MWRHHHQLQAASGCSGSSGPAPAPDPAPTLAPGEVRQLVSALDSVILKINDVLGGGGVTSGLPPRSCSLFVLRVRQFMVAAERGQSNWAALAAEVVSPHAESCNGNNGNILLGQKIFLK